LQVIRRHILPNVSSTVVTATTRQIPTLILAETALSYLQFGDRYISSWGATIAFGLRGAASSGAHVAATWWTWIFPVLFLSVTVLAFSVFGDALRDVLDPRGEAS
jgi:peptide/nickel transport system permease protein